MATPRPNAAAEEMRKLRPFWRDGRILQWKPSQRRNESAPSRRPAARDAFARKNVRS